MSVTAEAAHLLAAEPRMSPEDAREWLADEHNIRLSLDGVKHAQDLADALKARTERQFEQIFGPRLEMGR